MSSRSSGPPDAASPNLVWENPKPPVLFECCEKSLENPDLGWLRRGERERDLLLCGGDMSIGLDMAEEPGDSLGGDLL